jgi:hypothetical protein
MLMVVGGGALLGGEGAEVQEVQAGGGCFFSSVRKKSQMRESERGKNGISKKIKEVQLLRTEQAIETNQSEQERKKQISRLPRLYPFGPNYQD